MSLLLSGPIATLLSRLTAARAAYLDAAISSRAEGGSVYSSARAALLDHLDADISSIGGGTLAAVKLTSGSSWTHPSDLNTSKLVYVTIVGAGGGGERGASYPVGGGGGEVVYRCPMILTGSSTAYSIGSGGAGRSGTDGDGSDGGDTVFNGVTAEGGDGSATGDGGGKSINNTDPLIRTPGGDGVGNNVKGMDGILGRGGSGASSGGGSWGDGGDGGSTNHGSEGGGGAGDNATGGDGGDGLIIIEYATE